MPTTLDYVPVASHSGWVRAAAYDDESGTLYVRYRTATCAYHVPRRYYEGLVSAASAGIYIHASGLYTMPYTTV